MDKRIVILASAADEVALALPQRLSRPDVLVVTPADLSLPGWSYRPGSPGSVLVARGELLRSDEVAAVITRLPRLSEMELPQIIATDRAYVAAEMSAYLLAWLSEMDCPMANRPSPNCLCGPSWRHERWVTEASRAGLPVEPARRVVTAGAAEYLSPPCLNRTSVTVVGQRVFGDAGDHLAEQALRLALAISVETLSVHFSDSGNGMRFFTANPWPSLENEEVASALLDYLTTQSGLRT